MCNQFCFSRIVVSCSRNKHIFRCDQNGPPARPSEPDWQLEGAYLNRYVTDEQLACGERHAYFGNRTLV